MELFRHIGDLLGYGLTELFLKSLSRLKRLSLILSSSDPSQFLVSKKVKLNIVKLRSLSVPGLQKG